MLSDVSNLQIALAFGPVAGAFAIKQLWTRRRQEAELKALEERALAAKREAMRAMQQALVEAETARRTREEFLARMSHELRTPLNAVIGFSRVLESNKAGNQRPEDIHLLGRVRAGGEQLLRMVDGVLDQTQIERGQLSLALDDTDVVEIARRVATNFRSAAALKGLKLVIETPEHAPSIRLDAGRFEQVVEHLVDNAIKFTTSGIVKITLVTDAATHRPVRLIVSDTGIGIPGEQFEEIFQLFAQVETSTQRSYGGAGLGLPLARHLCQAMGCQLAVESEIRVGSRFVIRLPGR